MAQKGFNLRVNECKNDIVNVLNSSELPISVLALIMKEVNDLVVNQNNATIQNEQAAYEDALTKENEQETKDGQ